MQRTACCAPTGVCAGTAMLMAVPRCGPKTQPGGRFGGLGKVPPMARSGCLLPSGPRLVVDASSLRV
ncbi:hypothetical protein BVG79_01254 [Ketogulonicigenium robustum]|uniref:Uncharacterized protein n=1 Tax=Ketogulonicigenium robustum TaxID=92947 RepID=A0A1W6NZT8_9RHOB|nr:hypothetical protein BVG79_01254 [Ketogulonicigenium robustum]